MKRFRFKLVGLGCTLIAGAAVGAEGQWQPAGRSTPTAPVVSLPAPAAPAPLPLHDLPSRPVVVTEPAWQPITQRPGFATPEPPIKEPPVATVAPAPVATTPTTPTTTRPRPTPVVTVDPRPQTTVAIPQAPDLPAPRPVQPKAMPQPTPPPREFLAPPKPLETSPAELWGAPRPLPQVELPVAPPELMVPVGAVVPGNHGAFGSQPINLSRDMPTFRDMCRNLRYGVRERAGVGVGEEFVPPRGFVQAEYLSWWTTPLSIPILGTTNTQGGFGFLGEPGTVPIIGAGELISPFRNGVRARAGTWLGGSGWGVDGSAFYLENKVNEVVLTSDQFPIITRPVFSPNPVTGGGVIGETGEAVTVPGILTGSLTVRAQSVIWGFDANVRRCLHTCCDWHAEWFTGYRNVNMQESVWVTENINVVAPNGGVVIPDPPGTFVFVRDSFATENYFHGWQVGGLYERNWGRLFTNARGSVALGATQQELTIDGFQIRTQPGQQPVSFPGGGLLAAGPNLGTFTRTTFSVVSELTLNVGVAVTPRLRVYGGYNFMFWSSVIRPGDQIDHVVDLSFVPNAPPVTPSGQNRPAALFRQSDMFIHGAQFGLEFRW